jgi:ribokinase
MACPASQATVDSTGAGDSFNAAIMFGIATGMAPEHMLRLGAVTAGCKLLSLGARPGMPFQQQINASLLQ